MTALATIWSFATSRVGMAAIAAALAFAAGHHMAAKSCNAAAVAAELASVRADLSMANTALDYARQQTVASTAASTSNQAKVNALQSDLAGRSDRHCGLSADDARRLRDIK